MAADKPPDDFDVECMMHVLGQPKAPEGKVAPVRA